MTEDHDAIEELVRALLNDAKSRADWADIMAKSALSDADKAQAKGIANTMIKLTIDLIKQGYNVLNVVDENGNEGCRLSDLPAAWLQ